MRMSCFFCFCEGLTNINVSNFRTKNVIDMHGMFAFTTVESLDLSSFNTEKVEDMRRLFKRCDNLKKLNLPNFKFNSNTLTQKMFFQCSCLEKKI